MVPPNSMVVPGPEMLRDFATLIGAHHVLVAAAERAPYEIDWTRRYVGSSPVVLRPGSTGEVQAIIELCRSNHVSVVPQGGNTGLVGGGVPLCGEVVVNLRRLDTIGVVDTLARQVTVGAGVTLDALQQAVRPSGLRYAVDFGARGSATVGGSIATNAGGTNVLRHGGTRQQVIGVEAVLGNGSVISHLHGLEKDNTGYHLPSLLCGSEGTLGIVTKARLRLVSIEPYVVTALVAMNSVDAAVAAVSSWRSTGLQLEAAELMTDDGIRLVCDVTGLRAPFARSSPAYLLVEAAGHHDPTDALGSAVGATGGVADVAVASDTTSRAALWRYREEHTPSIGRVSVPRKFDVTLPLGRLAEFLHVVSTRVAVAVPGARTIHFGHVGDGNIHVNVLGAPGDLVAVTEDVDELVLELVAELDGSISAEHGIGTMKRSWLHLNRSAAEIAAMRGIKHALDPENILNPNVLLPPS